MKAKHLRGCAVACHFPAEVVFCLAALFLPMRSFARQGAPPLGHGQQVQPLGAIQQLVMPATDPRAELARDAQAAPTPQRFAVANPVQVAPSTHGTWEAVPGGRLWRVRVISAGATDLNFGFTTCWLPEGATLHIYAEDENYFQGPYTARDNKPHGQLWTPVLPGSRAVIELFVPADAKDQPRLALSQVNCGYRDMFRRQKNLTDTKAESCEIDVVCPQGDPWRNEIRSVAVYSLNGSFTCSGTLINNASNNFRGFFLTANHCGISSANAASIVVYWNFQSPVCGQHGGGSLAQNQSGAIFRAAKSDVDFALIELDDIPDPTFGVYYSGWDRSGIAPAGAVGIHHPNADEKSISFCNNSLLTVNSCIGSGSSTHWQVTWSAGVTEPGSSGSGIWDPNTHRLVGTLSGGNSDCSTPTAPDCYGKFALAWDRGNTAATRLRDWLDPVNTGPTNLAGLDSDNRINPVGLLLLAENCAPSNGVVDPGETVTVNFTLRAGGSLFTTNLVATLVVTGGVASPSGPQTYGALSPGATAARPFTFTATGQCGGTLTPTLQLQDGVSNMGTVTFSMPLGLFVTNAAPQTFSNSALITILDNSAASPYPSTIIVSGVTDTVMKVTATLYGVTHTFTRDIDILLVGPGGQKTILMSDAGGASAITGVTLTFDDAASAGPVPSTGPLASGTYAPVNYGSGDTFPAPAPSDPAPASLAVFNKVNANGAWSLYVVDDAAVDSGQITGGWSLRLTTAQPLCCQPQPPLTIRRSGSNVLLAWPVTTTTFTLESKGTLNPLLPWSGVTNRVSTVNGTNSVSLGASADAQFFRLKK